MKDIQPKGTGNSRTIKSGISSSTTWEQFRDLLISGTAPIDLGAVNPEGVIQVGDPLSAETLMPNDLATELGLNPETASVAGGIRAVNNIAKNALPKTGGTVDGTLNVAGSELVVLPQEFKDAQLRIGKGTGDVSDPNNDPAYLSLSFNDWRARITAIDKDASGAVNSAQLTLYPSEPLEHKVAITQGGEGTYYLYGDHNKPNVTDVTGAFPSSGGEIDGSVVIKNNDLTVLNGGVMLAGESGTSLYVMDPNVEEGIGLSYQSTGNTIFSSNSDQTDRTKFGELQITLNPHANINEILKIKHLKASPDTGTISSEYRLYGEHNKPTVADVSGAFSNQGGDIFGDVNISNGGISSAGDIYINNDVNSKFYAETVSGDDGIAMGYTMGNGSIHAYHCDQFDSSKERSLQLNINPKADGADIVSLTHKTYPQGVLVTNSYKLYGDHNKPTMQDLGFASLQETQISPDSSNLPSSLNWQGVAYGNGVFVAVAFGSDEVSYSYDLVKWNKAILPASLNLRGITFGNGKFVAIAAMSNKYVYSSDGIHWSEGVMPRTELWSAIAFGNGIFVALGAGGTSAGSNVCAYSSDGLAWTETVLPISAIWVSITFGDGRFYAIATNSNVAAKTVDGIVWTYFALPTVDVWSAIAYGGGKLVAVQEKSNKAAFSSDGSNWSEITFPSTARRYGIAFGNDRFVVLASNSDKALYSNDAVTWKEATMPATAKWQCIAFGDGRFVAIANASNLTANSADGELWRRGLSRIMDYTNNPIKLSAAQVDGVLPSSHAEQYASTTSIGHVKLSSEIHSVSETEAATPKAVSNVLDILEQVDDRLSSTTIPLSQKGALNGVAELDSAGKIPTSQLPSYVDGAPHIGTNGNWYIGETDTGTKASGLNGTNGSNGASAYEVAISYGFSGTENEWLSSLQGTTGKDGVNGQDGLSAYVAAQQGGYTGTVSDFYSDLAAIQGLASDLEALL